MPSNQINVRVTREVLAVLEALAYLERKSLGELVRPLLVEFAEEQSKDPDVAAVVEVRRARTASSQNVSSLEEKLQSRRREAARSVES